MRFYIVHRRIQWKFLSKISKTISNTYLFELSVTYFKSKFYKNINYIITIL